jgi:RimJ/RimL family protein N-acetyltransferase
VSATTLYTTNLDLVLDNRERTLARIEAMSPEDKAQLSADWLAKLRGSKFQDPWVHGFDMVNRETGMSVGSCGFKGPPDADGAVEIAYGVHPDHQRNGYATESAAALVAFAFASAEVRLVRAHTLPESNASTRVLTKCGFRHIGEVMDPEDGLVWRWEREKA